MSTITTTTQNWASGESPEVLESIHERDTNIAIFERDVSRFKEECDLLINRNIEFRSSGELGVVLEAVSQSADLAGCQLIQDDISHLLRLFSAVTGADGFRLLLAIVKSNMCTKFHTDINDLRMLCTYRGPGTLWLTEDNINREALSCEEDDSSLVIDEAKVEQASTGAVVILKGAIYPKEGTTPVLHRSPTIEESNETRLLLRIDTNGMLEF